MSPDPIRAPSPCPQGRESQRIGRYRLVEKLASGGMAQVYLAAVDGPEGFVRPLVVKTILPEYASHPDFAPMFATEAKTQALLDHPNIVQVYEFGAAGERLYLAMEWVEGASLDQLLKAAARRGRALGHRAACAVGQAMCEALAALAGAISLEGSRLALVHRDVNPGNILIARHGAIKLTDFGLVQSAQTATEERRACQGKFAYMSPEQVEGLPVDARSDLYALGVVLHEMVTGRPLFKREAMAQTMAAVTAGQVPSPRQAAPDLPEAFEHILLKALARDPTQRYSAASAMLADLEALRVEQRWPGGLGEVAALVAELCPVDAQVAEARREALRPGSGLWALGAE